MRDIYRVIGAVTVTIVAILGIGAALHVFMSLPFEAVSGSDKRAEWVGALGTVGTLIGTIWLATSESRARRRTELTIARLHASALTLRLVGISKQLDIACDEMRAACVNGTSFVPFDNCRGQLCAIDPVPISELIPLAALPNNIAALLAQAFDQIRTSPGLIDYAQRTGKLNSDKGRSDFAKRLLTSLLGTKELLKNNCNKF